MKPIKVMGLGLISVFVVLAFGFAGSASAKVLLFKPSTAFPYHMSGTGGASKLETVGGTSVESTSLHVLVLILNSTLFHAKLTFLNSVSPALGAKCQTPGDPAGTILINLLGHLGLTHPNDAPGVLLLIPSGFFFECAGIHVDVRGSVIGLITKPAILTKAKEMTLKFEQAAGVQKHKGFLLGNELLANQHLESAVLFLGGGFEEAGQQGEATLKATAGEFELLDE